MWLGRGVNYPPQYSAVVKERGQLYLYKCIITKGEVKTLTCIEPILSKLTKFYTKQKLQLVADNA